MVEFEGICKCRENIENRLKSVKILAEKCIIQFGFMYEPKIWELLLLIHHWILHQQKNLEMFEAVFFLFCYLGWAEILGKILRKKRIFCQYLDFLVKSTFPLQNLWQFIFYNRTNLDFQVFSVFTRVTTHDNKMRKM